MNSYYYRISKEDTFKALTNEEKVGPTSPSQRGSQTGVIRKHLNTLLTKCIKYLRGIAADPTAS